ncbi:hypothetical protein [Acinetobacter schindleri]|uniref:hypothetical protein n=1 Tax=Acinetobacter schindleri TaxID=108981 RepID=UPI0009782A22|nr:hypothetical protein [Acinetobacter schindleri]
MKRLLVLTTLITANAYANTHIKIEYDTETEKIKILDKTTDKECLKQINESKKLIKTGSRKHKGKVKMTFICMK